MFQKTVLDNGLRVVSSTMPHTRSVSICFFIGTGSRYETEEQAGISHFIEHLLFKGTDKRATSKKISEVIEGVGGGINGGTDRELTLYWAKVAQPHFGLAADVLIDMLLNSKLNPADIERECQVILEEISMSNDAPSQRVHILIDELLWPGHPLGRDIAGSKDSVSAITRDMIVDYLKEKYSPSNTVITVAGNIEHEEIVAEISKLLKGWNNPQPRPDYLAYEEQTNPRLRIEKRDTEQAHICLALPGLSLLHPQRFTLDLLNVVLGEGMSSRLFTEVRDRLGLAYSIHSYADHLLDSGSLNIYAGTEPANLHVAIEAILEQLSKLREPIPESELTKAKELSKGRLLLRMEDTRSVAGWMGGQEILVDNILTVDQVVDIIDAITTEQLMRIAQELIAGDRICLAVVGPVDENESLNKILKL
ncbi:M16 family metallopeptidase [Chloroflexota bacterium]